MFEEIGGIPTRHIRYDNLTSAVTEVLYGTHRRRTENERWVLFRSHYGFDAFYRQPGIDGAHEKGGIEGDIGRFRRQHLLPMPVADSLAELNERVKKWDIADESRRIGSRLRSVNEGEFVRRMRQEGLLVRPRFAVGRNDVVQGYSVALRPEKDEPVRWHGGGTLARDLTLPRLREGWSDDPAKASEAAGEWRATSKNPWRYEPVKPGREVTAPSPELFESYAADMSRLHDYINSVDPSDRATWAHVARETAGAYAAWSRRMEPTPGPLADAARSLARSAHLRADESRPRPAGGCPPAHRPPR